VFQNAGEKVHNETVARWGQNVVCASSLNAIQKSKDATTVALAIARTMTHVSDCVADEGHWPGVEPRKYNVTWLSVRNWMALLVEIFHDDIKLVNMVM
jgi:hypothetical protein